MHYAEQDDMFTRESAAKGGPVRMRPAQLNARAIGRVFNLFPESVFLVAGDGSVELPDEDGAFQVNAMDSSLVWTCDGDSSKPLDQDAERASRRGNSPGLVVTIIPTSLLT